MKKVYFLFLFAALLAIAGCSSAPTPASLPLKDADVPAGFAESEGGDVINTISSIALTEREQTLLSALEYRCSAFSYSTDDTYASVSVSAQIYRNGELTDSEVCAESDTSGKGAILMVEFTGMPDGSEAPYDLLIKTVPDPTEYEVDIEKTALSTLVPVVFPDEDSSSSFEPSYFIGQPIGKDIVLACVRFSDDPDLPRLSDGFWSDYKNHLDEIKDYKLVYVFVCSFSSEPFSGSSGVNITVQ